MGINPQIVFEYLWSKNVNQAKIFDKIIIITSKEGREKYNVCVAENINLINQYNCFGLIRASVVHDIDDTNIENYSNCILSIFSDIFKNNCNEVNLCISGGRRHNTAIITMAFSFFARLQDKLEHIIASVDVVNKNHSILPIDFYESSNLYLINIPFIRLGRYRPRLSDWSDFVDAFQDNIDPIKILFIPHCANLIIQNKTIKLQPMLAALLLCLVDCDLGETGIERNKFPVKRLMQKYKSIKFNAIKIKNLEYVPPKRVEELVSRINKLVMTSIKDKTISNLIIRIGGRSNSRYTLNADDFNLEVKW